MEYKKDLSSRVIEYIGNLPHITIHGVAGIGQGVLCVHQSSKDDFGFVHHDYNIYFSKDLYEHTGPVNNLPGNDGFGYIYGYRTNPKIKSFDAAMDFIKSQWKPKTEKHKWYHNPIIFKIS